MTLEEAKAFLRIAGATTLHDAVIRGLIPAATRTAEDFCQRAFIEQEWTITFDALLFDFFSIPDIPRIIRLPRPRLLKLDEVKFFKEDGTTELFTLTDLTIDSNTEPARIVLNRGGVVAHGPAGHRRGKHQVPGRIRHVGGIQGR